MSLVNGVLEDLKNQLYYIPGKGGGSVAELSRIKALMEAYQQKVDYSGFNKWFVPGTPYSIENCPKHKEFFDAGAVFQERLLSMGNRCLAEGTLIATPKGPVPIQELKMGDTVFNRKGEPVIVKEVFDNGVAAVGQLENRGKVYLKCTPTHELDVWTYADYHEDVVKKSAADLRRQHAVNRLRKLDLPLGDVNEPDAYALGALLGDGCCTCGSSKVVVISSADDLIPNKVASILAHDDPLQNRIKKSKSNYSYHIHGRHPNYYKEWMDGKLCHEKIIDLEVIKTWNRRSLLELFAGLLDTDGSFSQGKDGGALAFCNQSKSAVEAFAYCLTALWGIEPTVSQDYRDRYKNGPILICIVRNPYELEDIGNEIKDYVVHTRKIPVVDWTKCGKRSSRNNLFLTFKDTQEQCRVYDIQVDSDDHCYLLANGLSVGNCGKTLSGSAEAAMHATGLYPSWWQGRRFTKATNGWACAKTKDLAVTIVQKELLGNPGALGTGMIPRDLIVDTRAWQGMSGGVSMILVKHVSGGISTIGLKAYDQGVESFYGRAIDWVWDDEEPPQLIYSEQTARLMTTNGIIFVTSTPLSGLTPFVADFERTAVMLGDSERAIAEAEDDGVVIKPSRCLIRGGWDHAPWLTEEAKSKLLSTTPVHLRLARSKGLPAMGSGNVYPLNWEDIAVPPFEIPKTWRRWYAMDQGWNNTAVSWFALDPNDDVIYIYSEYKDGKETPAVHAARIKEKGDWIPGVMDPAGRQRAQDDGRKLIDLYRQQGLRLIEAKNAQEAGVSDVWERLSAGKLRPFNTLHKARAEYMAYRRGDDGKIIKEFDHVMDTWRYGVVSGIDIGQLPPTKGAGNAGYAPRRYFN